MIGLLLLTRCEAELVQGEDMQRDSAEWLRRSTKAELASASLLFLIARK